MRRPFAPGPVLAGGLVALAMACAGRPDPFTRDAAWCRRAAAPPPTTGGLTDRPRARMLDLEGPELATGDRRRRYRECMAARFRERFPEAPLPPALRGERR